MRNTGAIGTFSNLHVTRENDRVLTCAGAHVAIELSLLSTDLFRFRATTARRFSAHPSWSVCHTDWPCTPAQVTVTNQTARIQTQGGTLELNLRCGVLRLLDAAGRLALNTDPQYSGFQGRQPVIAIHLAGNESLLAMGESSGPFDRRGLLQKFWNTDALGHGGINPGLRNLYTSIPFGILMRGASAVGVFWDSPVRQEWDLGQTNRRWWQLKAASGEIDLYLFPGPRVSDIVERYTELTGRMPMPPRWALGYQQCRYSYQSRKEVEKTAQKLRRRKIPCDALYLDIHHMDRYRVFTFGMSFPKPAELIRRLHHRGFRTVAIVDPGVKYDTNFGLFQRGNRRRAYVRTPDGKRNYIGTAWPGRSVYPDFLNRRVREWWGAEQARLQRLGVAGLWNDMNEPTNFALPSKTLPERCLHLSDNGPMRHAEAHNLYGMQMARASREGALKHQSNQRPFVITRATYAGGQRHAMLWTGDNASSWEHLGDSVQMLLNLGLSGFPFCGSDAGGFLDNCTPELYARWMQVAAFTPFFRNHTMCGTLPHEPWAFGAEVESIARSSIELRYQLLPYWYCLFAEAHRTGTPIMRPLLWHYQADPVAAQCGDQFLLGSSLLVAPILQQGAVARSVYLPDGVWSDYWTGQRHRGRRHVVAEAPLHRLPLFVPAGSIVPTMALAQHTAGPPPSLISLHIWPGAAGELEWYEDDGQSMAHLSGGFHRRTIALHQTKGGMELRWMPASGVFESRVKKWRIIVHGAKRAYRITGAKVKSRFDRRHGLFTLELKNLAIASDHALQLS